MSTISGVVWTWSTVAICVAVTGIQLYQLTRYYTKLRTFCFICSLTTDVVAVLNASRVFDKFPDYLYQALFVLFSSAYILLFIIAFLDLGMQFYPDGRLWGHNRVWKLLAVLVLGGIYMTLSVGTAALFFVIRRVHETYYADFCVSYGLAVVTGVTGAHYAFAPLMGTRGKQLLTEVSREAYAVGFWYLATCYAITILYGLFYIVILAKGEDYFTLPSCHGADFIFRMTFSFNFSTTPPRTVITFIAEFKKSSPQIDHGTAATVGTVWTSSTSRAATAENDIDIERRIGDAEREPDDPLQSLRLALQQKLRIPETVREPMMMGPITKSAGHGKTNFMGAKSRKQSATPLQDVEDECEAEERLSEDPAILNDPDDPTKALRMALKQKMKGAEPARKMPVTQPPKVARK